MSLLSWWEWSKPNINYIRMWNWLFPDIFSLSFCWCWLQFEPLGYFYSYHHQHDKPRLEYASSATVSPPRKAQNTGNWNVFILHHKAHSGDIWWGQRNHNNTIHAYIISIQKQCILLRVVLYFKRWNSISNRGCITSSEWYIYPCSKSPKTLPVL